MAKQPNKFEQFVRSNLFPEMPPFAMKIFLTLLRLEKRRGAPVTLKKRELAEASGLGERSLYRIITLLEEAEIISVERRGNLCSIYRITLDL